MGQAGASRKRLHDRTAAPSCMAAGSSPSSPPIHHGTTDGASSNASTPTAVLDAIRGPSRQLGTGPCPSCSRRCWSASGSARATDASPLRFCVTGGDVCAPERCSSSLRVHVRPPAVLDLGDDGGGRDMSPSACGRVPCNRIPPGVEMPARRQRRRTVPRGTAGELLVRGGDFAAKCDRLRCHLTRLEEGRRAGRTGGECGRCRARRHPRQGQAAARRLQAARKAACRARDPQERPREDRPQIAARHCWRRRDAARLTARDSCRRGAGDCPACHSGRSVGVMSTKVRHSRHIRLRRSAGARSSRAGSAPTLSADEGLSHQRYALPVTMSPSQPLSLLPLVLLPNSAAPANDEPTEVASPGAGLIWRRVGRACGITGRDVRERLNFGKSALAVHSRKD